MDGSHLGIWPSDCATQYNIPLTAGSEAPWVNQIIREENARPALTHISPQLPNRHFCCLVFSADVTAGTVLPTMISTAHMACGLPGTQHWNHPDFRHARVGDTSIPRSGILDAASSCVPWAVQCRACRGCMDDHHVALDTISDSKQTGCVASGLHRARWCFWSSQTRHVCWHVGRDRTHSNQSYIAQVSKSLAHRTAASLVPNFRVWVGNTGPVILHGDLLRCSRRYRRNIYP